MDLVLDGNPAGGSGTYTTHAWTGTGAASLNDDAVQSPTFNNATAGTYDLTYTVTDDNGCTGTDDITVTVNGNPTAAITPDPAEVCAGVDLVLDGNPAGGSGTYTTHAWTGAGAASLDDPAVQSPTFNNATAGTYDLTYTVTDDNGCTGTDDITVTVKALPILVTHLNGVTVTNVNDGIKDEGSFAVCSGVPNNVSITTAFQDLATLSSPGQPVRVYQTISTTNATFGWCNNCQALLTAFVPPVLATATLVNPALPGSVVVTWRAWHDENNNGLIDVGECQADEIEYTVTVNGNPTAAITPDPAEVCAGVDLVLDGNPAGGSGAILVG